MRISGFFMGYGCGGILISLFSDDPIIFILASKLSMIIAAIGVAIFHIEAIKMNS